MRGPKLGTKIENAKAIIENISTTGRENQRNPTVERNARDRSNISNQTVPTIGENTGIMNQLVCQRQRPRPLPPPPYYLLVSVIHKFDTHTRTHYVVSPPRFSNSSTLTRRFGVSSEISSRVESSRATDRVGKNRKSSGWVESKTEGREGPPSIIVAPMAAAVADRNRVFAGRR